MSAEIYVMSADGSGVTMISMPTPFAFNGFPSRAHGHGRGVAAMRCSA
jgi:hypothetical protein